MIENMTKRLNFEKVSEDIAAKYFNALVATGKYILKSDKPADKACWFSRKTYLLQNEKVVFVHDTKANMLSIVASDAALVDASAVYEQILILSMRNNHNEQKNFSVAQSQTKESTPANLIKKEQTLNQVLTSKPLNQMPLNKPNPLKSVETKSPLPANSTPQLATDLQKVTDKKPHQKSLQQKKTEPKNSFKAHTKSSPTALIDKNISISKESEKKSESVVISEPPQVLLEYKDGYAIKKFNPERLEGVLKRAKELNGITVKSEGTSLDGTDNEVKTYIFQDSLKQKVTLRYMTKKNILQLQGKRSNLFSELQVLTYKDSDYIGAVGSHIELTGEDTRAAVIERQLKKLIPDAFNYLSEQSKIDLSICMIDINKVSVELSDYSCLLVPPYRGLERLIYDLQNAQGITVKMIGQAYEKLDNVYTLKSGYMKKIQSVIFNEVMSALYTEYYEKRNFYAHSDNSFESQSRVISDKAQAKAIFDKLLSIINYNCKKLKEIGFSIK